MIGRKIIVFIIFIIMLSYCCGGSARVDDGHLMKKINKKEVVSNFMILKEAISFFAIKPKWMRRCNGK